MYLMSDTLISFHPLKLFPIKFLLLNLLTVEEKCFEKTIILNLSKYGYWWIWFLEEILYDTYSLKTNLLGTVFVVLDSI